MRDYSYDLEKINIVDWEEDFYEYCKDSAIWKLVHSEIDEENETNLNFDAVNNFFK